MLTLDIITARRWSCCFYDNKLRSELVLCHIHSRLASLLLLVMGESPIFPPSSSVWRTSRMSHIYTVCKKCWGIYADAKMMLILQSINCLAAPPLPSLVSLPTGKVVHCSKQIPSDGSLLYLSPARSHVSASCSHAHACAMNAACPNTP